MTFPGHNEPIKYGDPGKLIHFAGFLYDKSPIILQKKINRFLQEMTESVLVFMIQEVRSRSKAIIRVIGEHVLFKPIEMQSDCLFLRHIKEEGGGKVENELLDPLVGLELRELLLKTVYKNFVNCFIIPIRHPVSNKINLYVGFVNYPREFGHEILMKEIAEGCFKHCLPVLKSAFALEEEKLHRKMCEDIFKTIIELVAGAEDELAAYKGIRANATKLFEAEYCTFHLNDENFAHKLLELYRNHQSMWEENSKTNLHDLLLPDSCRIANAVADTGRIINCKDVEKEPYAHADLIKVENGMLTIRNSLTFPVMVDGKVKGVIEVFNRVRGDQFTSDDEELAEGFGGAIGMLMRTLKLYRRIIEKHNVRQVVDCLLLRNSGFFQWRKLKLNIPKKLPMLKGLYRFTFDPYSVVDTNVYSYVIMIFHKLNILSKLNIDEEIFSRFLRAIIDCTPSLPFHNIQHTFNAFHFILMLIYRCNIRYYLGVSLKEILVLLIASLAQDIDWRGSTTPFQVVRGTSLPSLYTSPGMVEKRLTASQLIRIATSQDLNIFKLLEPDEYKEYLELLYELIIATDISHHILKKPTLAKMVHDGYSRSNVKHRRLLLGLFMTTAQLSIYTRTWEVYLETSKRLVKELFRQGDLSNTKGGIDYSSLDSGPDKVASMHLEFIAHYCIPAFSYLRQFLPNIQNVISRLVKYEKEWKVLRDEYELSRRKDMERGIADVLADLEKGDEEGSEEEDEDDED